MSENTSDATRTVSSAPNKKWQAPKLTLLGDATALTTNSALATPDGSNGSS
jgi:hypothetical protein